jgi:uncharacterized protein YbjT (DUF2867 family)
MAREAILAGATGLVGRECLRLALERYDSVTALVRRPLKITHPRLIAREIDFDRLGTIEVPRGAHVYCALGTTIKKAGSEAAFRRVDFEYPRMLAERAAAGDARFMLVSSVGASTKSPNFYLRVKGELEDAVRAMAIQASTRARALEAVHIFQPSILMGDREERRAGERIGIAVARATAFLLAGPLRKYRGIPAATVAAAMVGAAQKEAHGCFVYHYDEIIELAAAGRSGDDRNDATTRSQDDRNDAATRSQDDRTHKGA